MENLGTLAILLAFCFAIYAVIGSVAGKLGRRPFLILSAERAVYCVWALLTVAASAMLVYSLIAGDFRLAYVAEHSNQVDGPASISSPPGGADRKARCCCGPGCSRPTPASWFSRTAASSAT